MPDAITVGGFGVRMALLVTGTSVTGSFNIYDAELPEFEKTLANSTHHGSTGGYSEWVDTGEKSVNPFTMNLFWDSDGTSHAALLTAWGLKTGVSMILYTPENDEIITFPCHIQKVGRVAKMGGDALKCAILVQPTGVPVIT